MNNIPINVVRLLADKSEIEHAMRRYIIANNCTQKHAYECVIAEVSEHLPEDQRPWQPYKNYEAYNAVRYRAPKGKKIVKG